MAPALQVVLFSNIMDFIVALSVIFMGTRAFYKLPLAVKKIREIMIAMEIAKEKRAALKAEKANAVTQAEVAPQTKVEVEEETIVESFIPKKEEDLSLPAFLRKKISIVELGFIFEDGKLVKQPEMPIKQYQEKLRDSLLKEAVEIPAGAFGAVAC